MNSKEALAKIVSHETIRRLDDFEALLKKWNPAINLISRADTDRIWPRHILDSVQVFNCVQLPINKWFDFGSGGGFPGIVCAVLCAEKGIEVDLHLVESDTRKAVFLRQIVGELSLNATVHAKRIEAFDAGKSDVISARALASLSELLEMSYPHSTPQTQYVFPKGRRADQELNDAQKRWDMRVERIPSLTDGEATILKLTGVTPRP